MTRAGTIVCDVTDPLAGRTAAEFAGALGRRLGLRLVLVLVGSDADQRLAGIAREIGPDTDTRIVTGDHAEAVARVAAEEGADLVVVGSRQAGLGGRNLRWAPRDLEEATPVPLLVAPPSTRRRSRHRLAFAAEADPR